MKLHTGVWRIVQRAVAALVVLIASSSLAMSAPTPADAYCASGISAWTGSSYTLGVSSNVPSSWNTSINNARLQWDDSNVNWYSPFNSTLNYNYPVFNAGAAYAWYMSYDSFTAIGWNPAAPGGTLNNTNSSPHSSSRMRFNSDFTWNFSGTFSQALKKADVHTVVMHEMGHSSGLNHPDLCGPMTSAEVASSMNANWTKKWSINSDDAAGIHSRY